MLSGVEIGAPVVRVRTNVWLQLTPQSRPKVRWKTIVPSPTVGCSGTGDVREWKDKSAKSCALAPQPGKLPKALTWGLHANDGLKGHDSVSPTIPPVWVGMWSTR